MWGGEIRVMPLVVLGITFLILFVLVEGGIRFDKYRNQARRHPLTHGLLRGPGNALREKVDNLKLDLMGQLMMLLMMPMLLYAFYVSEMAARKSSSGLPEAIYGSIAICAVIYTGYRITRLRAQIRQNRLGLDCEVAVGQELNSLMANGFYVYHDFPAENFNIDHIVIGPTGVFAVETKGRSKRMTGNGRNDAKVVFDGRCLLFPQSAEVRPLEQARLQAQWLSNWLNKAAGEQVQAVPTLVIPGWFVSREGKSDVIVFNGKNPSSFFFKHRPTILDQGQIARIRHQVEQKCRIYVIEK
jgi:hypothetical protein